MEFKIKGNYFESSFHMPKTSGADAVENIIKRYCPGDLDNLLWELPIEYRHVDPVVDSATKGFQTWRKLNIEQRAVYLKKFQSIVSERKDELAYAIAMESGKPLWEAHTEVASIIGKVDVTLNEAYPRIKHKEIANIMPNANGHVYYKPLGPCLIIGPFNFPCHLANGQLLSALTAGNSVIFKPSEKTAYSGQLLIECYTQAEFPNGVINLIQGDGEIARRVLKQKAIKGIYFTGSKEVGKKIIEATHQDLNKLVCVELGGKNSSIVHQDANLDLVIPELLKACFLTTGQRCVSTSLVVIHKSLVNQVLEKFHDLAKKIIIDHPVKFEKEPFMGPLIDQNSLDKYLLYMGMAKREGIEEVMRGKQIEKRFKGHYVSPSIHLVSKFREDSVFIGSEIFGPNSTFIPYDTIDEAVSITNSTEYGLAAGVFSADRSIYNFCVENLDTGVVNFNRSTVGSSAKLPFGGIKNSGNYRPASLATIDSCVYQMASLDAIDTTGEKIESIKGIEL